MGAGGCTNFRRRKTGEERSMAMLIRRSVRGGLLRRAGATWLLPASRQTEVIPSLAASLLSSFAAGGAAARLRISPIRSKGQCIYRTLCDGSGSTHAGRNKPMFLFLAMMKGLYQELVKRYRNKWIPLPIPEKVNRVACTIIIVCWIKSCFEDFAMRRDIQTRIDQKQREHLKE